MQNVELERATSEYFGRQMEGGEKPGGKLVKAHIVVTAEGIMLAKEIEQCKLSIIYRIQTPEKRNIKDLRMTKVQA